jgi:hypothetical protein
MDRAFLTAVAVWLRKHLHFPLFAAKSNQFLQNVHRKKDLKQSTSSTSSFYRQIFKLTSLITSIFWSIAVCIVPFSVVWARRFLGYTLGNRHRRFRYEAKIFRNLGVLVIISGVRGDIFYRPRPGTIPLPSRNPEVARDLDKSTFVLLSNKTSEKENQYYYFTLSFYHFSLE